MYMHARELLFVLDATPNGSARVQMCAYYDKPILPTESVETGTVVAIPTDIAKRFIKDLITEGTLPLVLILRWRENGNHFQAVTYSKDKHQQYVLQIELVTEIRNRVSLKHGGRSLDSQPYDHMKTARAAAQELKSFRRRIKVTASTEGKSDNGSTTGGGVERTNMNEHGDEAILTRINVDQLLRLDDEQQRGDRPVQEVRSEYSDGDRSK
ncbi:hypothetical protein PC128_g10257 [Phytophthora cactorum]|nr:hypothetical protein GQ600_18523 [Phytophthora cactorum]KAG3193162.1 hypothetical protein PC128_g10257 [Phytophthora cactorum]KAG4038594.1 hypothetical protein PC123_g25843 [Phytophthora cactorum]